MDKSRYNKTIAAFDEENAKDPNIELVADQEYPKELLYAQRMSECLKDYLPDAPETLRLATRCQHIRRWEIARDSFPPNRKGYLLWRSKLKEMHSKIASDIMLENGYDSNTIRQVSNLLLKKGLKIDPEVQALEDVICLVFLEYYFEDFAKKHDDDKIKDILLKTMNKMSDKGLSHAKGLEKAHVFLQYVS